MSGGGSTRREVCATVTRWVLLLGSVGGVAVLGSRKGEACSGVSSCGVCPSLTGCGLPASRRYREQHDVAFSEKGTENERR